MASTLVASWAKNGDHALAWDEGEFKGVYHSILLAQCGGKVWHYPDRQECDICGKTWLVRE